MRADDFENRLSSLRPLLVRFSRKFVANSDDSGDLVQDTLLRALRYRNRFKDDNNLQGWLFVIMRNTFINQYRKARHERGFVSLDATQPLAKHELSQNADAALYAAELQQTIDAISADLRKAFLMHMSGYKYDEISEHLSIPLGTVKSRIFLARQELQKRLHAYN